MTASEPCLRMKEGPPVIRLLWAKRFNFIFFNLAKSCEIRFVIFPVQFYSGRRSRDDDVCYSLLLLLLPPFVLYNSHASRPVKPIANLICTLLWKSAASYSVCRYARVNQWFEIFGCRFFRQLTWLTTWVLFFSPKCFINTWVTTFVTWDFRIDCCCVWNLFICN